MNRSSVLAYCALAAFALFLVALGTDLTLKELFGMLESKSREATLLTALALVLSFFMTLPKR